MSTILSEHSPSRRRFLTTALAGSAALALGDLILPRLARAADGSGPVTLPPLPWPEDALSPHISARTIGYHYGKHHRTYVTDLNRLISATPFADQPLVAVIEGTANTEHAEIFNNAAQVWNHTFYWNSLRPKGGGEPSGALADLIEQSFGDFETFKAEITKAATSRFGSGWVWLVKDGDRLAVTSTGNADTPIAHGQQPLLAIDLWEHAYYLDFQNRREEYVTAVLDHLINWDFAAQNLNA